MTDRHGLDVPLLPTGVLERAQVFPVNSAAQKRLGFAPTELAKQSFKCNRAGLEQKLPTKMVSAQPAQDLSSGPQSCNLYEPQAGNKWQDPLRTRLCAELSSGVICSAPKHIQNIADASRLWLTARNRVGSCSLLTAAAANLLWVRYHFDLPCKLLELLLGSLQLALQHSNLSFCTGRSSGSHRRC